MSINFSDKLIITINKNLEFLCDRANVNKDIYVFDKIENILYKFVDDIKIYNNKEYESYYDKKKKFKNFLNCDIDIVNNISILLIDSECWNAFFLIILLYLTFLKDKDDTNDINYNYMINKLFNKIDNKDEYPIKNDNGIINNLLYDIKDMLSNNNENIIDLSKKLSNNYQEKISNGDFNFNELLTGVSDLLKNPEIINETFKDFDISNLSNIDSNELLKEISNVGNIESTMNVLNSLKNNNLDNSSLIESMNSILNISKPEIKLSSQELDNKIEGLLNELI